MKRVLILFFSFWFCYQLAHAQSGGGITTTPQNATLIKGSQVGSAAAAQSLAVPFILVKNAVPYISLSSCTAANNGAFTACTALPQTYPGAWIYAATNTICTANAAGWYWAVPSSTTAMTVYNNNPAAAFPSPPPAIPTAFACSHGTFTGDTAEEFLPNISIAANALGKNGQVRLSIFNEFNNNGNAKRYRIYYSGSGGTNIVQINGSGSAQNGAIYVLANTGATNQQILAQPAQQSGSNTVVLTAVDTTAATTIAVSLQKATATDNIVLELLDAEVLSDGN